VQVREGHVTGRGATFAERGTSGRELGEGEQGRKQLGVVTNYGYAEEITSARRAGDLVQK